MWRRKGGCEQTTVAIPLSRGFVTVIDRADAELVGGFSWYAGKRSHSGLVYAVTNIGNRKVYLHRLITNARRDQCIDHIDGDQLNNRRSNLRFATKAQNSANQGCRGGASRFKGVHPSCRGRWVAQITCNRKCHHLGTFSTEEEAAAAYDEAAKRLHGEYARLNLE